MLLLEIVFLIVLHQYIFDGGTLSLVSGSFLPKVSFYVKFSENCDRAFLMTITCFVTVVG